MTRYDIYDLCNKHGWFTNGDNGQYERVMKMADRGEPLHDIALCIWICSKEKMGVSEIEKILKEKCNKRYQIITEMADDLYAYFYEGGWNFNHATCLSKEKAEKILEGTWWKHELIIIDDEDERFIQE